jgi:hypothetical protein
MAKLSSGTLGMPSAGGIDKMPVTSTYIQYAEYDPKSLKMTVTFQNGSQRSHAFVYPQVWQQFKDAQSKGRAYNQLFKGKSPSTLIINTSTGRNPSGKKKL